MAVGQFGVKGTWMLPTGLGPKVGDCPVSNRGEEDLPPLGLGVVTFQVGCV